MNPPAPSFVDSFAGSGMVTKEGKHACVPLGSNDICPKEASIHQANRGDGHFDPGSIEQVRGTEIPKVDIVRASFPSHDRSLAGNTGGFAASRSGLFREWLRVPDVPSEKGLRKIMRMTHAFLWITCSTICHAQDRWTKEIVTVPTKPNYAGPGADFKIDSTGTVHCCYASTETTTDTVTYVRWNPSGRQRLMVLSHNARRSYIPKIALSPAGNPVVAYVDGGGVKVAKYDGVTWHTQTVSSTGHYEWSELSLAVDSNHKAHVLFNGFDSQTNLVYLNYMHESATGWESEFFHASGPGPGNHGEYHDLVLSESNEPHIMFQSVDDWSSPSRLKYASRNSNGQFVIEHISDYNSGDIEMYRENNGVIHAVHAVGNSYLAYARRSVDGIWSDQSLKVPNTNLDIQASNPDISWEHDQPVISYRNNHGYLATARLASNAWMLTSFPYHAMTFQSVVSNDHRGGNGFLVMNGSAISLNFDPKSHLPAVSAGFSTPSSFRMDLNHLTPDTVYVLSKSSDLIHWNPVRTISSPNTSFTAVEEKAASCEYFRIELPE